MLRPYKRSPKKQLTSENIFMKIREHELQTKTKKKSLFPNWQKSLVLGIACTVLNVIPVQAAETLFLLYGPLRLSLRVSSLETFAEDGTINQNLGFYMRGTTPQQQERFREALTETADLDPLLVSRFFNTGIGEDILTRIGNLITIQGGRNGKYAIRGALVQAAMSPEGLSLINFLRKLPTNMEFQGNLILKTGEAAGIVVEATETFVKEIENLATIEANSATPVNFASLPDLGRPGSFAFQQKTWNLLDQDRNRRFRVIIYQPQQFRAGKTPVVIISHGLASNPENFADVAQHLASYGYVVALPQHPGSDSQQALNFKTGRTRQIFELNEFIDRPKDISYVIDELERRNQGEFQGKLDLENVGVAGHSFGGYGVLAVAGATIDFDYLKWECDRQFGRLNMSLLLQCRALDLPRQEYNFSDQRVKAVFAANPVNSSIFGPKGLGKITIPILIGAGTFDPATPFIFEQVRSFPWFTTPDKYLAAVEGQAHVDFSQLDANVKEAIDSIDNLTLPSPDLIESYIRPMQVAFFEVYLTNNSEYRPFLQSQYAIYLSQDQEFGFHLITAASSGKLEESLVEFRDRHRRFTSR
jgi:predicted dienelactone hydrolase